jgi:terminase, large subunit
MILELHHAALRDAQLQSAEIADRYFAPMRRLDVVEWLEENVTMPPKSPRPGNLSFTYTPTLREIVRKASRPDVRIVYVAKPSQIGFTVVVLCGVMIYRLCTSADSSVFSMPTERDAIRFSKTKLTDFIEGCPPALTLLRTTMARDPNDTILYKQTSEGTELLLVGMESSSGLKSFSMPLYFADEIDEYHADEQGDPMERVRRGQLQYDRWRTKEIAGSTPTDWRLEKLHGVEALAELRAWRIKHPTRSPGSRIWQLVLEGDQRQWYCHCPHCRDEYVLSWQHIRWPEDGSISERAAGAYAVCTNGCAISPDLKERLVGSDDWRPSNPDGLYHSYFHSGLTSFAPSMAWSHLALEFLRAGRDPVKLKPFMNQKLGLPFEDRSTDIVLSASTFRRDAYAAEVPLGVGLLTMAVDVQTKEGDERLEVLIVGWGVGEESWRIHHYRLKGSLEHLIAPEGQPPSPWQRLTALRRRYYVHEAGGALRPTLCGIDSADGNVMDRVYAYVRAHQAEGVIALRGEKDFRGEDRATRSLLVRDSKSEASKGIRLVLMNTYALRDDVYRRLSIRLDGYGCMHWPLVPKDSPEFQEDYFRQFSNEVKEEVEVRKGGPTEFVWKKKGPNEGPDLEVQSLATYKSIGSDITDQMISLVARVQAQGAALKAAGPRAVVVAPTSADREMVAGRQRPR